MIFTIKKGNHTSDNRGIRFVWDGQLHFDFLVSDSWLYDENAPGFQPGWNKLIGIREGFNHHRNSVRLGWRCINNSIFVCSYCYINGVRTISDMIQVDMGWNRGSVQVLNNSYRIVVNNQVIDSQKSANSFIKMMLYPYFGGNSTAPHDMEFEIHILAQKPE